MNIIILYIYKNYSNKLITQYMYIQNDKVGTCNETAKLLYLYFSYPV